MIEAVAKIAAGHSVAVKDIPVEVQEFFLMKEYPALTPREIRSMSRRDVNIFTVLAAQYNRVQNNRQNNKVIDGSTMGTQTVKVGNKTIIKEY